MSHRGKLAVAFLMALVLLVAPTFGCGGGGGEKKITIVVGQITDVTGPAASFLVFADRSYDDTVRYINEEDPIPGAEIKIALFDSRYDPSRDLPGYEWLKERGAAFIYSGIPTVGDTLKSAAARDEFPIVSSAPSLYQLEPPGWVLGLTTPVGWVAKGFVKWISETRWDYQAKGRKPKIGSVGWDEPYHVDVTKSIREYCTAHPDKFDYVAGLITPMGGMTWSGEIGTLKDCDFIYIPSTGLGTATFAKDYRDAGGKATFIGLDAMGAFLELLVEKAGWNYLDGSLTAHTTLYWNDNYPIVNKAKEFLTKYRPADKDHIMSIGVGYVSTFFCAQFMFDLLRQAVTEAGGVENFNGEAFYNTALHFNWTQEGLPARGYGFADTIRYARKDFTVYEWKASAQGLVRVSDWLPCDNPTP